MDEQFELNLVEKLDGQTRQASSKLHANIGFGIYPLPALLHGETYTSARRNNAPSPVKPPEILLPRGASVEEAFCLIVLQCKWHIMANVPAVQAGKPEGLHQMRVGFRRLRVALSAFGAEFRHPVMEGLRFQAKHIAEELAPARDLDVFLKDLLEPPAQANGAKQAFDLLRQRAIASRGEAWMHAVAQVCAPSFSLFLRELGDALDYRIWKERPRTQSYARKGAVVFDVPIEGIADRILSHRFEYARKRAKHLADLETDGRHRLRIALKKMRYTSEFFAPLYPKKSAKKFLKHLSDIQDILGTLNDVATAHEILEMLVDKADTEESPAANPIFAAGVIHGWHVRRADRVARRATKYWDEFRKSTPFWLQ
jgi:triphosphatase